MDPGQIGHHGVVAALIVKHQETDHVPILQHCSMELNAQETPQIIREGLKKKGKFSDFFFYCKWSNFFSPPF